MIRHSVVVKHIAICWGGHGFDFRAGQIGHCRQPLEERELALQFQFSIILKITVVIDFLLHALV